MKDQTKPGEFGPYRQSERLEIHQAIVNRLVEQGDAYPCFCTAERLRQSPQRTDRE